jgi:ATP-dependent protease HslVU (ClpYQ) peptidase subunit
MVEPPMTCIVGIVSKDGCVIIGGDSAGVSGYDLTPRRDPKVFQKGEFLYGFTQSFRMGQLIRFKFHAPAHEEGVTVDHYLHTVWLDELRKCFDEGGFMRRDDGEESGGTFLVGYRGRLFCVQGDFQISESLLAYFAIGCGDNFALGAMHALQESSISDEERVRRSLVAAELFSAGVCSPFTILTLAK